MIHTTLHGDVLEIVLDHPPVNAVGAPIRNGMMKAIDEADSNPAVKSVVIRGAGKQFSAGADITEFDQPVEEPYLPQVVDRIEACTKPVIAAIHGTCFGGGLEITLGSHYRIAAPSALLGVPEVKIGVLPGAGGTQRIPRLIGIEPALQMIVSGDPISATQALELGLIDKIVDETALVQEAFAMARSVTEVRRVGDMKVAEDAGAFERFAEKNARKIGKLEAPNACIAAVKSSIEKSFEDGKKHEWDLFMQLLNGAESEALRHVFFSERLAARITDMPKDIKPRPVGKVGVIGAGTMGGGISMNFLSAGMPVTIVETAQDALERGVGVMRKNYEASAAKGRITTEQVEEAMSLLTPTLDFDALAECDLIIEAVYENIELKQEIFARLDKIAKPGAILASNTSFLDLNKIAEATARPQDVVGMHFFSPANVMKLLEVVRGEKTAYDVLHTAMTLGRRIGKVSVVAGVCHGFIGNRMLIQRQDQADALLRAGASPAQVDKVHTDFGMPMGPFQMIDLAGVDIGWHRDPTRIESVAEALCAKERWGQKKKAGYYDYDDKRRPTPSPVTEEIINDFRAKEGIKPRAVSDEEIVVRTLYIMVNEAALILEEEIAQRASDVDIVWVYGYGWPRHRGGPMFWADAEGLEKIVAGLEKYKDVLGPDFKLSSLLQSKAKAGETFI